MNILSLFSFLAFLVYLYLGIYTIRLDPKSKLNRTFFYLNLTFAVWAFAYTFFYSAHTKEACWYWYKFSSVGWCFFPAVAMHFFLILTEKENVLQKWWAYPLLYLPAMLFFYKALTGTLLVTDFALQGLGWCEVAPSDSLWFWAYALYYSIFIIAGLALTVIWGHKSNIVGKKRQAKVIVLSAVPTLLLSATTDTVLPAFNIQIIPSVAVILILTWIFGIWYAIVKYRLMILTPSIAADEIISKMLDLLVLVNPDRDIIKVNRQVTELLGYREDELIGKPLSSIILNRAFLQEELPKIELNIYHTFNGELTYRKKEGDEIPVSSSCSAIKGKDGDTIGTVIVGQDLRQVKRLHREIAERKHMEETIRHQAYHDALTGLPNRILFKDRLSLALSQAYRSRQRLALLFLDLDHFKTINDSLGHTAGDRVLWDIAELLRGCVRESDTVARMGGDEYTILLTDIIHEDDIASLAQKILSAFKQTLSIDGYKLHITTSIGISIFPNDGEDAETLLKNADTAMYHAKERGRNNYQFFNPAMNVRALGYIVLGNSLLQALERKEFEVHYQPQVDTNTGEIIGMEALLRWQHPELGLLYPRHFMSLAEKIGLMIPIDEWVLRTACAQNKAWQEAGLPPLQVAVNLSPSHLPQPTLIEMVENALNETSLDAGLLALEITERSTMQNVDATIPKLSKLSDMGIHLSIDDFGAGHSSLTTLKQLPVHMLKIDRSFIRNIKEDSDDAAIVRAVIGMAKGLDLKTTAEGVETEEQRALLCACKCDTMQGFLFGHPLPNHDMEKIFSNGQSLFKNCEQ